MGFMSAKSRCFYAAGILALVIAACLVGKVWSSRNLPQNDVYIHTVEIRGDHAKITRVGSE